MNKNEVSSLRFLLVAFSVVALGIAFLGGSILLDALMIRKDYVDLLETVATMEKAEGVESKKGMEAQYLERLDHSGRHTGIHLMRDVGIALIVSVVLVVLLERANRKVLIHEFEDRLTRMATNLLGAVYEHNHPQSLYQLVQQCVFMEAFSRDNYEINLSLHNFDDHTSLVRHEREAIAEFINGVSSGVIKADPEKLVILKLSQSYVIKNVSSRPLPFQPPFRMERYFPGAPARTCCIEQVEIGTEPQLKSPCYECDADDPTMVAYSCPPVTIGPGDTRRISSTGFAIRHLEDQEMWCCRTISHGMTINLTDNTGKDLYLELSNLSMFPKTGPRTISNIDHASGVINTNRKSLNIQHPILPWQGAIAKWSSTKPLVPKQHEAVCAADCAPEQTAKHEA